MSKPSWIYALVEDQRQRQLIYRYLLRIGVPRGQITIELSPAGHGSAEQWVRENFARQVGKCRARNARAATAMITILDADRRSVDDCLASLQDALRSANLEEINPREDKIAMLIAKRNIETWILVMSVNDRSVFDEVQDYKPSRDTEEWSALIPIAIETLCRWTRSGNEVPGNTINSLRRGVEELLRIRPN